MKNILIFICLIISISSCKTREIISKGLISEYNLTDETLLNTEVYVTDPIRLVFDTTIQTPNNRKGFISVDQNQIIQKVNVKLKSKGIITSIDNTGKKLVVGVLFERKAEPIYFSMNKRGILELIVINNKVKYIDNNYELVSNEIPYLEVVVKKNKRLNKSKIVMTGY